MKYQHVKRTFKNPLFVWLKKHYCPACGSELMKVKTSKIVNSKSEEASEFDFQSADTYMIGDVKFIWTEFKCPHCGKQISVEEMKMVEKKSMDK